MNIVVTQFEECRPIPWNGQNVAGTPSSWGAINPNVWFEEE